MFENPQNSNHTMSVTNVLSTKIVVLPHWLLDTLKVYNKPLKTVLNANELLDILLLEDIAKYIYLNERLINSENNVMKAIRFSFDTMFMECGFLKNISDSNLRSQLIDKIHILPKKMSVDNGNSMLMEDVGFLQSTIDPKFLREWKIWELVGLFSGSASPDSIERFKASRGFELLYIDEHHMGLKLVEGTPNINPDRLLLSNLDNCMEVLNQYYEFRDIAKTQLFDLYCKYTSQQTLSI